MRQEAVFVAIYKDKDGGAGQQQVRKQQAGWF